MVGEICLGTHKVFLTKNNIKKAGFDICYGIRATIRQSRSIIQNCNNSKLSTILSFGTIASKLKAIVNLFSKVFSRRIQQNRFHFDICYTFKDINKTQGNVRNSQLKELALCYAFSPAFYYG